MKKIFIALVLIAGLASCNQKIYPVKSCNMISEHDGTLTLRSVGYGKQKNMAIDAAETNALETLLFRGIPETQYNTPLVAINEADAKARHREYFDELFKHSRSKSFITSSVPVSDYSRNEYKAWSISVDVTINVVALRRDLEQHGIIRKFGL